MKNQKKFTGNPGTEKKRTPGTLKTLLIILLMAVVNICCGMHGAVELDAAQKREFQPDPAHIEIVSSYFGAISRIHDPAYEISVIDDNMDLDKNKWKEMCRRVANNGASAIRMMPYWPPEKEAEVGYMPYKYRDGKYDLEVFNEKYFHILKEMVRIANSYKMKVYISLYEACGMRKQFRRYNPWSENHQLVRDFRHTGPAFDKHRARWERKVYQTLRNERVGYEICNEPTFGHEALFKVYKRMRRNNIPDSDIIMGVRWNRQLYRPFKNLILEKYGEEKWVEKKHQLYSTIHHVTPETFKGDLAQQEGHTRRFWLSADGLHPKPTAAWWEKNLGEFFKICPTAPYKNRYAIETMHKKPGEDDIDSALGISRAIYNHTGKWPQNYGKYPKEEPPVIKVEIPNGGEKWEVGSFRFITWTTTAAREKVKIQYTADGQNWTAIHDAADNIGSYAWTVPAIPATKCRVKVSDLSGINSDISDGDFVITTPGQPQTCENCYRRLLEKIKNAQPGILERPLIEILIEWMQEQKEK